MRNIDRPYMEFWGILEHIVVDEGLSGVLSYLGQVDHKKLYKHIDEFYEHADALHMHEIVRCYNVLQGRCEPDSIRYPKQWYHSPSLPDRSFPCAVEIKNITGN
jgi:hypothetical protein